MYKHSFSLALCLGILSLIPVFHQIFLPALHRRSNSTTRRSLSIRQKSVAPGIDLRVLPLGDSITFGFQSTDGNGYREALHNDLTASGSNVDFIGSVSAGNMADNQNEGHSGFTISQIASVTKTSLLQRPNVVLLHAGTNDMQKSPPDDPYDTAPERLGALIDEILCTCPDAVVMVAQIIQSSNSDIEARIRTYNAAIPSIVAGRAAEGFKVKTVDMSSIGGSDLFDSLHPNDGGYVKMATLWYQALQAVDASWFTKPQPAEVGGSGVAQQCAVGGLFWYGANDAKPIASGVGSGGNGKFTNNWNPLGQVASGIGRNGTGVMFGDLDGDGKDDYLWVNQTTGAMIAYYNRYGGAAPWIPINDGQDIASGVGPGAGVRIADLNGDGKDDYLYVHTNGALDAYINRGPSSTGWNWQQVLNVATGVAGANQDTVLFADINGDGRADYCVENDKGGLDVYLNIGNYDSVSNIDWQPYLNAAGGLGNPNITLADLDGDGRADYLMFDQDGGLDGYTNVRGKAEGQPVWIPQGGAKSIAGGVAPPGRIRLADLNGDGKVDYLIVNDTNGAISAYLNNGAADTAVTGDGVRIADLDGDGIDDYLAVDVKGAVVAYRNGGPAGNSQGWVWFPVNNAEAIATGIGALRHQIHFADINGDGRADYLAVDDKTGAVTCYLNGGANTAAQGGWVWLPQGQIASGIGEGAGVRFADIDGDGKADYIWLSEGGAATVYINQVGINPANWVPLNGGKPIATGVGAMRRDVQFADIDGDRRAEYLWVHPILGSVDAWTNGGLNTNAADGWIWIPQGQIASGIGFSGPSVTFGRIGSSGRADYIGVEPASGALTVYLNGCSSPIAGSGTGGSASGGTSSSSCGAPPLPPNTSTQPPTPGPTAGSGDVYIDPSIWTSATPIVSCIPPCDIILPPYTFSTTTTISFPPFTTTLTESWVSGSSIITVLTITYPPLTTTEVPVYNLNITNSGADKITYTVTPSIFPVTSVTIGPPPGITAPPITTAITSTPGTTSPTPIVISKPTMVSFTNTLPPGPPCRSGCGEKCKFFCNDCGLFGCDAACPGCVLPPIPCLGPLCSPGGGGGGGGGGSGNPDPTDNPTSCATSTTASQCEVGYISTAGSSTRVTSCYDLVGCNVEATTTTVSTISNQPAPYATDYVDQWFGYNTNDDQAARDSAASAASSYLASVFASTRATTTSPPTSPPTTQKPTSPPTSPPTTPKPTSRPTSFISCSHRDQDPGEGINDAYCVCSGSTFAESVNTAVTPANSCAYTTLPSVTTNVSPTLHVSTNLGSCQVCTIINAALDQCTSIDNCTPTSTPAPPGPTGCVPKTAPKEGSFIVYSGYTRHCSEEGELQVCSVPTFSEGVAPGNDWTCDFLGGNTIVAISESGTDFPYPRAKDPPNPPDTFALNSGVCDTSSLTFTRQCDGSYFVTSKDQGGTAVCTNQDLPDDLGCTFGLDEQHLTYTSLLLCKGTICNK